MSGISSGASLQTFAASKHRRGLAIVISDLYDPEGVVGAMADTHYSVMGYQGADSSTLENESAPAIARAMLEEHVDLALLAPV